MPASGNPSANRWRLAARFPQDEPTNMDLATKALGVGFLARSRQDHPTKRLRTGEYRRYIHASESDQERRCRPGNSSKNCGLVSRPQRSGIIGTVWVVCAAIQNDGDNSTTSGAVFSIQPGPRLAEPETQDWADIILLGVSEVSKQRDRTCGVRTFCATKEPSLV